MIIREIKNDEHFNIWKRISYLKAVLYLYALCILKYMFLSLVVSVNQTDPIFLARDLQTYICYFLKAHKTTTSNSQLKFLNYFPLDSRVKTQSVCHVLFWQKTPENLILTTDSYIYQRVFCSQFYMFFYFYVQKNTMVYQRVIL